MRVAANILAEKRYLGGQKSVHHPKTSQRGAASRRIPKKSRYAPPSTSPELDLLELHDKQVDLGGVDDFLGPDDDVEELVGQMAEITVEATSENQPPRQSTRVAARAPNLENFRWQDGASQPSVSDETSEPSNEDNSDSEDDDSDDDEDEASECDPDDDLLSAWELLGEEFEREAHSLGLLCTFLPCPAANQSHRF